MVDYRQNVVSTILPQSSGVLLDIIPAFSEHRMLDLKKPDADVVADINSYINSSRKRCRFCFYASGIKTIIEEFNLLDQTAGTAATGAAARPVLCWSLQQQLSDMAAAADAGYSELLKLQGLLLLEQLLGQCSAGVFSNNFQTWLQLLMQAIQAHGSAQVHQCTLQVLEIMITKVTAFPELARDVGMNKMKPLLTALLSLKSKETREAVMSCIIACILHFPGPTRAFIIAIENLLVEKLDESCPSQVAIRCYALLARCTTGGNQGEKHREVWTEQYNKLMSTLNSLLAQLYTGLETGEEMGEDKIFHLPVPNTQPDQTVCLTYRFNTLCACLGTLLREPFPTWVPLQVEEVLHFICRTLAVQMDMLVNKASTDQLLLLTFLPLIHSSALGVLSSLIVCAKRLLIPSGETIVRLCVQSLASTHLHKVPSAAVKPFRKLRQAVYRTLETWLQITGFSCCLTSHSADSVLTDLLSEIFSDIDQQKPEALQLEKSVTKDSTEPPAKKKKKKGKKNNYQELSVSSQALTLQDNTDTVLAALTVLKQVITYVGVLMPEAVFSELKMNLCQLVHQMQQMTLAPYTSSQCRQLLYDILRVAVGVPKPDPLLLQQAVAFFQRGCQDKQFTVAAACREAIAWCQNLIHPLVPCLCAPVVSAVPTPSPALFSAPGAVPLTAAVSVNSKDTDSNVSTSLHRGISPTHNSPTMKNTSPVTLSSKKSSSPHRDVSSPDKGASSVSGLSDQRITSTSGDASYSKSVLPKSTSPERSMSPSSSTSPTKGTSSKRKREDSESDTSRDNSDDDQMKEEGQEKMDDDEPPVDAREKAADGEDLPVDKSGDATPKSDPQDSEDLQKSADSHQGADVSSMMMSFIPCSRDTDDDSSESD